MLSLASISQVLYTSTSYWYRKTGQVRLGQFYFSIFFHDLLIPPFPIRSYCTEIFLEMQQLEFRKVIV